MGAACAFVAGAVVFIICLGVVLDGMLLAWERGAAAIVGVVIGLGAVLHGAGVW